MKIRPKKPLFSDRLSHSLSCAVGRGQSPSSAAQGGHLCPESSLLPVSWGIMTPVLLGGFSEVMQLRVLHNL